MLADGVDLRRWSLIIDDASVCSGSSPLPTKVLMQVVVVAVREKHARPALSLLILLLLVVMVIHTQMQTSPALVLVSSFFIALSQVQLTARGAI